MGQKIPLEQNHEQDATGALERCRLFTQLNNSALHISSSKRWRATSKFGGVLLFCEIGRNVNFLRRSRRNKLNLVTQSKGCQIPDTVGRSRSRLCVYLSFKRFRLDNRKLCISMLDFAYYATDDITNGVSYHYLQ